MSYKVIGNTIVEWDDNQPFKFRLRGEVGPADRRTSRSYSIDLTPLRKGFTDEFLHNFREYLLERNNHIKLSSVDMVAKKLKSLFNKIIDLQLFEEKISVIDEAILLCISSVKENLTSTELNILKAAFKQNPYSAMFSKGLNVSDFPNVENRKGAHGSQIDHILSKAMNQSAVAHILDVVDRAYAEGRIDIGYYSFVHLAFAVFVRPESYRQIRIGDFYFDDKSKHYFIDIVTSKSSKHVPDKVRYRINEPLGKLLTKQRQHVIATYGYLVAHDDIEEMALFPARKLVSNGERWKHEYANQNYGLCESADCFYNSYFRPLNKLLKDDQLALGANSLRHTVGTLLAQTGASSTTIQAVLKHASDVVCRAYVDIAFHGMMNELSNAMRPPFSEHLPGLLNFRSKEEPVALEKLVQVEDLETGHIVDMGACGKEIACEHAPLVCYSCMRFIPNWDADHSIHLESVEREIEDMTKRGKTFSHLVERARTVKNRIVLVMNAADRYRDGMHQDVRI